MKPLAGRTALLTGASRGIGVHIARALAKRGMDLVLAARSAEPLEKLAAELASPERRTLCVPSDVAETASLEALVARARAFGGVDVLVNNAGIEDVAPFHERRLEDIDRLLAVNLRAPIALTRLLLPDMLERGRGHVVNIASLAGLVGTPYNEIYSASKHGLMGLTRSLRVTARGEGYPVGFSAVCPGFVADAGMFEHNREQYGVQAPTLMGSSAPEKVAHAVVRAIEDDVPEIVVNPGPMSPLLAAAAFFPGLPDWVAEKSGVVAMFQRAAAGRRERP